MGVAVQIFKEAMRTLVPIIALFAFAIGMAEFSAGAQPGDANSFAVRESKPCYRGW